MGVGWGGFGERGLLLRGLMGLMGERVEGIQTVLEE